MKRNDQEGRALWLFLACVQETYNFRAFFFFLEFLMSNLFLRIASMIEKPIEIDNIIMIGTMKILLACIFMNFFKYLS